jgi:hypothetical protein
MSNKTIKPIQTHYKGYHFRSRLEARWAVFFDAIGWQWEYEPEGFDLGEGDFYLPDFRLICAEENLWVEIKAKEPNELEWRKAWKLAEQSQTRVVFGVGLPDPYEISQGLHGVTPFFCRSGKIETRRLFALASINTYCKQKWGRPGWGLADSPCEADVEACNAAKSARFEFGQKGAAA